MIISSISNGQQSLQLFYLQQKKTTKNNHKPNNHHAFFPAFMPFLWGILLQIVLYENSSQISERWDVFT